MAVAIAGTRRTRVCILPLNNSSLLSLGAVLSAVNNCRNDVTGPAVVHMHRGCSRTLNPEKSGMRVAGAGVCTGIVVVRHDATGLDLLADPSGSGT